MRHFYILVIALVCTIGAHAQYTLTANDVEFDNRTGTIVDYTNTTEKDIVIPRKIDGVKVIAIGDGAFTMKELTKVIIPRTVTIIGDSSFYRNEIANIKIPRKVTYIGEVAFSGNSLTSISIPKHATKIGDRAFAVNKLTSFRIPKTLTIIGRGVFAWNDFTSITIPKTVVQIRYGAFYSNQLTSVEIPNTVKLIGKKAFDSNEVESINLPAENSDGEPLQWFSYNVFVFDDETFIPAYDSIEKVPNTVTDLTKGYTIYTGK